MKAKDLREKYISFFQNKGHNVIPSASLVPENDPTVLFTTAGMHPLVPYLLGEKHALGKRLVNIQKCIRTGDIEEVGDNSHLTFFEMLGNWSLGDYFKKESIEWSFEFLTKELNIPLERLAFSVFEGEGSISRDNESAKIWLSLGVLKERIAYLPRSENWWGPAGETGPCGPDTEIFYFTGNDIPKAFDPEDPNWIEIWNNVFMEYNKTEKGKFIPLSQKNVDTGMGLERVTAVLQGKRSVFETELFLPIIEKIREMASREDEKSERIITDHIRSAVFILSEKVIPSNTERGYVLRRIIRRAIRHGKIIGIESEFTLELAKIVIDNLKDVYPEINQDFILKELAKEESCFQKTLEKGLKEFQRIKNNEISGKQAFDLYQTYGFPIEMTEELAKEVNIKVDLDGFKRELEKHQELSRTASVGKFKAGLSDYSEKTIKYHTAAHLLHAGLRSVLGEKVHQMGSNITPERIRFDFSFERKMTKEELKKVEDWINEKIKKVLHVKMEEISIDKALKEGALAFFRDKYPDKVKVYTIHDDCGTVFSKEICSGPHANSLSGFGKFRIIKEKASSSGVRRIKAVLE